MPFGQAGTIQEEALLEEIGAEVGPTKELTVFNDDVNTFEHAIRSLVEIRDHDPIQAEQCTLIIHYRGKCGVKRGPFDKLEPMCTALHDRGISADIL